jgi:multiple sugar transport system permease protein
MRTERGRERAGWYLVPAGALLCVVVLFPMVYVGWLSLERWSLLEGPARWIGLDNYLRVASDGRFWNALGNTVYFTVVSVLAELALGLAIALLLHRQGRGRALLYGVVLLPWAVPTAVSARMWEWMYNTEIGVINYLIGVEVNWLGSPGWAMHAAIAMDVWKSTPFVALLLIAGLQGIPGDLYRAAAVDGARGAMVLRTITLPLLAPVMLVAVVFRAIDAFRVFDTIYVLTGGGPADSTETLSIYVYRTLFHSLEFGYGSALAVVTLGCAALLTMAYVRLLTWRTQ